MQTSSTSVLERRVVFSGELVTHPFEAGWATEARFFVQLKGNSADTRIQVEISPDGLHWLPYGEPIVHAAGEHLSSIGVAQFGSWLRAVLVQQTPHEVEALVHLTLKG